MLAYDTGTLDGERIPYPPAKMGQDHVFRVCKPSWWLSPQSRDDCSHAAGHGFFYYFLDIGRAVSACWSDDIVLHTPGPDEDRDDYTRMAGLSAGDMLKWRWLCATGVYHAAGNTLSLEILDKLVSIGSSAEEYLCKRANVWGENDRFGSSLQLWCYHVLLHTSLCPMRRYFDRCAAGLGIKETEMRLQSVSSGKCASNPKQWAAAWELQQLDQFGQAMQPSCNPAKYFVQANDMCPAAFRAHFPCQPGTHDYVFCTGRWGGAVVKGIPGPR